MEFLPTADYLLLVREIMNQYKLDPINSFHGVQHWGRVNDIGQAIVEKNGGNPKVVRYFGLLHDCCRENEKQDPNHGRRAAQFAIKHRDLIELDDDEFKLLFAALAGHADDGVSTDPTIGAAWDGDRLQLARVGIMPNKDQLSTDVAKEDEFFNWANKLNEKDER